MFRRSRFAVRLVSRYRAPPQVKFIAADGIKLHGWLILAKDSPETAKTLVFCHANAGNMGYRLPNMIQMGVTLKVNIFIFDYRGCVCGKAVR